MSEAMELVRARNNNCTLYELEGMLQALVDSIYSAEDPASRELILDEIDRFLVMAKEKRDAVVAFLSHCEQQQAFADAEIARLRKRKELVARVQTTLEKRIVQVIDQFATPDRKGIKRLEGFVSSMRIQKNPDSVIIHDDQTVPAAWKDVVVTLPAVAWEHILRILEFEDRAVLERQLKNSEFKPDKRAIAAELKNHRPVSGADLKVGDYRLVIE